MTPSEPGFRPIPDPKGTGSPSAAPTPVRAPLIPPTAKQPEPEKWFKNGIPGLSLALGVGSTVLFYTIVINFFDGTEIERYTNDHWIENATVGMFAWAMFDLIIKCLGFGRQRRALKHLWLPAYKGPQSVSTAGELYDHVQKAPAHLRDSFVGRRLEQALHYVKEHCTASTLENHLRYLAENESSKAHSGFSLVRFVAWVVPILGFLGTVIGITMAIANLTPEQLEGSLTSVTQGLAVAFDTTALSLFLSMILMFTVFLIEKAEQNILGDVDDYVEAQLIHRFRDEDPQAAPYLNSIRNASEVVIHHTKTLADKQHEHMQNLVQNQVELWTKTITTLQQQYEENNRKSQDRFRQVLESFHTEGHKQSQALATTAEKLGTLQADLQHLADKMVELLEGEKRLASAEGKLNENLRLLRESQSFEQVLHSLTAAVHMLTARSSSLQEKRSA